MNSTSVTTPAPPAATPSPDLNAPTRVWEFGCLPPTQGAPLVAAQVEAARTYYNDLIDIENWRRTEFRKLRRQADPELDAAEAEVDSLNVAIDDAGGDRKAPRALLHARRAALEACVPLRDKLKRTLLQPANAELGRRKREECQRIAKEESRAATGKAKAKVVTGTGPHTKRKARRTVLDQMLQEDWPQLWKGAMRLDDEARRRSKEVRNRSQLLHGTYNAIHDAFAAACSTSSTDPRHKHAADPIRIGVQLPGGVQLPESGPFVTRHSHLEIDPVPEDAWATRSGRRHARTNVRIRVATQQDAAGRFQPVWAEFPVLLHRRPRGLVTWAYVKIWRCGLRLRYRLLLSARSQGWIRPQTGSGTAYVNLGWRCHRDGRLRVAYLVDDQGHEEELTLDRVQRDCLELPSGLRAIRDLYFERVRGELQRWMRQHPKLVSPELAKLTEHIGKWRATSKLARAAKQFADDAFPAEERLRGLWQRWVKQRLRADKDLFAPRRELRAWLRGNGVSGELELTAAYVDFWRRKNRHLYGWEASQRASSLLMRRELYRIWAARICATYQYIVLEDFDMRRVAKRPPKWTELTRQEKLARRHRVQMAVSTLRLAISTAARPDQLQWVTSKHNTRRCRLCGEVHVFDAAAAIHVICPRCLNRALAGRADDQDRRNCLNQRTKREEPGGSDFLGGARPSRKRASKRASPGRQRKVA